jgi:hypothetical protein
VLTGDAAALALPIAVVTLTAVTALVIRARPSRAYCIQLHTKEH